MSRNEHENVSSAILQKFFSPDCVSNVKPEWESRLFLCHPPTPVQICSPSMSWEEQPQGIQLLTVDVLLDTHGNRVSLRSFPGCFHKTRSKTLRHKEVKDSFPEGPPTASCGAEGAPNVSDRSDCIPSKWLQEIQVHACVASFIHVCTITH